MAASIIIPGRSGDSTEYRSSTMNLGAVNKAALFCAFRVLSNPSMDNLVGSPRLVRFGANNSGGSFGLGAWPDAITSAGGWRVDGGTAPSTTTGSIPVGETMFLIAHIEFDASNGVFKWGRNGELMSTQDIGSATFNSPSSVYGMLGGATLEGRNIEHFGMAAWHGDELPAMEELLGITDVEGLEGQLNGLSVPPVRGWIPSGNDGVWVDQLAPTWGDLPLTLFQGAGESDPDRAYFVAGSTDNTLTGPSVVTTARSATFSASSSVDQGVVYIAGDLIENWLQEPSREDIAGGFLGDGVTEAAISRSVPMTGEVGFSEEFTELMSDSEYTFYAVQDFDGDGDYSNVVDVTAETKRPIVSPAGEDKAHYDSGGSARVSEAGITLRTFDGYEEEGLETDAGAELTIDLTTYNNDGGGEVEIGDNVDLVLVYPDGEGLFIGGATVAEG